MSKMNMRKAYGEALLELGQTNEKIVALEADLGKSTMSNMFGGEFMSLSAGRDEARVAMPFEASRNRIVVQHTSTPFRGVSADEACRTAARRGSSTRA